MVLLTASHSLQRVLDLQVRGWTHSDSAEEDEGMHGTRAAAGSTPGQAPSPGPDKMLSQDEEEDCMLDEEDCKEKHLTAGHESERLLEEEVTNIDDDDDVQFMGETGPGAQVLAVPATTNGFVQELASSMQTATCSDKAALPTHRHTCPQRCSALVC
jgi:hypothetical protein